MQHDNARGNADLGRGKAKARRVVHGHEHIVAKLSQIIRKVWHRSADLFEAGVGVYQNRPFHRAHLGDAAGHCNTLCNMALHSFFNRLAFAQAKHGPTTGPTLESTP